MCVHALTCVNMIWEELFVCACTRTSEYDFRRAVSLLVCPYLNLHYSVIQKAVCDSFRDLTHQLVMGVGVKLGVGSPNLCRKS